MSMKRWASKSLSASEHQMQAHRNPCVPVSVVRILHRQGEPSVGHGNHLIEGVHGA